MTGDRPVIAAMAGAFAIQSAALAAGAFWLGFQLHKLIGNTTATPTPTARPAGPLRVVTAPRPGDPNPGHQPHPMA